jgi:hypothetical protein
MRSTLLLTIAAMAAGCASNNHKIIRSTYVRELGCPSDKVFVMNFPKDDKRRGEQWQVYGCDQRRICFDDTNRGVFACRWPDDLQAAASQLRLLTNCPTESMTALAYSERGGGPTPDDDGTEWVWQGGAYRIDACGTHFVCSVMVNNAANCQPAPDLAPAMANPPPMPPPAIPPPPPPPPPSNPGY